MHKSVFITVLMACLFSFPCWGQTGSYKFRHLDIANGLSNNQVNAILKDSRGFIWFGTANGLNRFDGSRFLVFRNDPAVAGSLPDNQITSLFEDETGKIWIQSAVAYSVFDPETERFSVQSDLFFKTDQVPVENVSQVIRDRDGNFWVANSQSGLYKYEVKSGKVINALNSSGDPQSVCDNNVSGISADRSGGIWIVHGAGMVEKIDPLTLKVVRRWDLTGYIPVGSNSCRIMADADQDVWVYSRNVPAGLVFLNTKSGSVKHLVKSEKPAGGLSSNLVSAVVQDDKGVIWVSTDHGGINLICKPDFSIRYLWNNPDDETSLSQNSVTALYKDDLGTIWAGTFKMGISYYHEGLISFQHYKHLPSNDKSLMFSDVDCFEEDLLGNLWIGTNGGGLICFDRRKNEFRQYLSNPDDPNSLSSNVIVSLYADRNNDLWIGTYLGGLNRFDGKNFIRYPVSGGEKGNTGASVWDICEDRNGNFWLATMGNGAKYFNPKTGSFLDYLSSPENSVRSNFVFSVCIDSRENVWFGTSDGLDCLDKATGRFTHYGNEPGNTNSLSNNNVYWVVEDSRHLLWVCTRQGLTILDPEAGSFTRIGRKEGLPDESVLTILQDKNGSMWASTGNGLSNIRVSADFKKNRAFQIVNFDTTDGLQGKEFNTQAAFRTRNGELIFGGPNGFNILNPGEIRPIDYVPNVVLTDLLVFNKKVAVHERLNGRVILDKVVTGLSEIELKYRENVFSIQFTALDYFYPEKYRYEYKLEGFNTTWLTDESKNKLATYTNLDPGEYRFRVRVTDQFGRQRELSPSLKIVVRPPFWRTHLAFVLYVILLGAVLVFLRHSILERERLKFRAQQEHQEAERVANLDRLKTRFFTNVSHEFRTPLSLILAPVEKMLDEATDPRQRAQLGLVHRNARRLLNMVNQLLDFRKMEFQDLKVARSLGEIIGFIRETSYAFTDLSEKKGIHFCFETTVDEFYTRFDRDKLEKILFNLLSNAHKFTPENGRVTVSVSLKDVEVNPENADVLPEADKTLVVSVEDSGIGIPADKLDRIFERFFQDDIPAAVVNQGTGIGLSLVAEFLRLLGGRISVKSEVGQGSCFTVELPVKQYSRQDAGVVVEKQDVALNSQSASVEPVIEPIGKNKPGPKKNTVLLVEDNDDFRFYLKDNLSHNYHILEAENGKAGWKKCLNFVPDLVVSDVAMPLMDGLTLCNKIKTDPRTSHIPVILLTARISDEQKLEGLQSGADDYITKPFDSKLLEPRIENLIRLRAQLRESFNKRIEIEPAEIPVVSLDEKLIGKAVSLVGKHLENPDFSVEELSRELGMSRVHLYKKLLSLTGKTPVEFIRDIRLEHAVVLLEKSQLSVSEVAYKVGFNNPRYFSRYFKEKYNRLPSECKGKGEHA